MSLPAAVRDIVADNGVLIRKADDLEVSVFENDPDSWMAEVVVSNIFGYARQTVFRTEVRNQPPGNVFNKALEHLRELEKRRRTP